MQNSMKSADIEARVLQCNKLAMDALKFDNFRDSIEKLRKAEALIDPAVLEHALKLLSITYNNFGCHYKRRKQYKVALEYLSRAQRIEEEDQAEPKTKASTHLNISALYSALKRHNQALWHAKQALDLLKEANPDPQVVTSIVISYFNAGAELEHLNRPGEAVSYYKQGWEAAMEELGPYHPMTTNLLEAYKATKGKAEATSVLAEKRQLRRNLSRVSPHKIPRRFMETSQPERLPPISSRTSVKKVRKVRETPLSSLDLKPPQAIDHMKYLRF